MTIFYKLNGSLYVNVTNRCPCSCTFCIRRNGPSVGDADTLWLDHEPTLEEIRSAYETCDTAGCPEVVFCGYGEPMERLDIVLETCKYLRRKSTMKIRINTNGLSDLINGKPTAHLLSGLVDIISISLNASNPKEYARLTRSQFGEASFEAMLNFAKDCKKFVPQVVLTVVDVLSPQEIAACQRIADEAGMPLRVRAYEGAE